MGLNSRQMMRDVVRTVIRNHPSECIFIADAEEHIVSKFLEKVDADTSGVDSTEILITLIRDAELYCPHEGINRLPKV